MIKLSRGNLLREKSVTLANLSFPRETVNKSSFPRTKPCSVTTAEGNGYETIQTNFFVVAFFSLFFGLDRAQNTILGYSVLRN